ncbi:MAG: transglutaminase family protein, partial [Acetobacteraceae bacterium]|nr:transglutaminase family protein [Acetobacteraceae bacterium]
MMRVAITHRTAYRYSRPVRFTRHQLMTRPRDSHDMQLIEATLSTTPAASLLWKHDVFGNSVGVATFAEASDLLEIVSHVVIEHYPAAPEELAPLIEPYAKSLPFAYQAEEVGDLGRFMERNYPDPGRAVDGWVKTILAESGTSTASFLRVLTQAITERFTYAARDTQGTNDPATTLATKTGACRDFALLMMEAVRALGLAARFVTGYLYDAKPPGSTAPVVGGGATHAWCDVYIPGIGWVEFDPTNALEGGQNLVRIATVRAPEQAVPISGGYIGAAGDFLGLEVAVEVAVGEA